MPLLLLLCALTLTAEWRLQARDILLVRSGDVWSYFPGTEEPSLPGAWKEPGFDDRAWLEGMGGFSSARPYSQPTILINYGLDYQTLYLRRKFLVANPASIHWLTLRIDYEHGFIAYLNGREIARRNVPGTPGEFVPFHGTTEWKPHGLTEEIDVSPAAGILAAGENVLAIQLLGAGMRYDTWIDAELLANFTRAPFIQNTSTNSTAIVFKTLLPLESVVEFRTDGELFQTLPAPGTNHMVQLTGLRADTTYTYRVAVTDGTNTGMSDWSTFKTLKTEGSVRIAVLGDTGWMTDGQFRIADRLRETEPDLVMHLGDIVYPAFSQHVADFRFFSIYSDQMRRTPLFVAVGNHEMYVDRNAMFDTFVLPTNHVTGTEHYYSFDHGDVHFVAVWVDRFVGAEFEPGSPQYNWLENDLANTAKPWKFMFFHHVLQSSAVHSADDYDRDGILDSDEYKASVGELASRYGVQLIFNGHDHDFERFAPLNGPISFVSGGGGANLYPIAKPAPLSARFESRFHFLDVLVDGPTARIKAIDTNGIAFDTFEIRREFSSNILRAAEWNSPRIESSPANDGDGNIMHQEYNLKGAGFAAVPGKHSHAGRLLVNKDRDLIYFGFDQVMLQPGQGLYLFAGVKDHPGVTNLRGLGDRLLGEGGEGVDALDLLGTVTFTNFAPSIGAILGDELADTPSRTFARPGFDFGTGQGAFYLSEGFPDVPRQKLQQFNRSPQDAPAWWEANANHIELAIPCSVFGALQPGDIVQAAAVVGIPALLTNGFGITRDLDSGGIASAVVRTNGTIILESVEFVLPEDPDPDSDGLATAVELSTGTDPNNPDSDGDGLLDGWEVEYELDPLSTAPQNGAGDDPDEDGLSNLVEALSGTNPRSRDSDVDGLPDSWEVQHGLNPGSASGLDGAAGDPDLDRLPNLAELAAGTDPRDAASALRLRVSHTFPGPFEFRWTSVPGKTYVIETAAALSGPYEALADSSFPRTAQAAEEFFMFEPEVQDSSPCYFRLKLLSN